MSPHANAARHFRHIVPLIPVDDNGRDRLRIFTDAVEKSKRPEVELTQEEFDDAMEASGTIQDMCVIPMNVIFRKLRADAWAI